MLVVTLRRGLAGKNFQYKLTLQSLGLQKTRDTVILPNNASVRGAIEKVHARATPCFLFLFFCPHGRGGKWVVRGGRGGKFTANPS